MASSDNILDLDELTGGALIAKDPPASASIPGRAFGREWRLMKDTGIIAELSLGSENLQVDDIMDWLMTMVVPSQRKAWKHEWNLVNANGGVEAVLELIGKVRAFVIEHTEAKPAARKAAVRKKVAATKRTAGTARR